MEFRCRLASPNGQVIEGVYSADSEARLRHELEEKGLFVLSLQQKGAIGGLSLQLPQSQRIPSREFLVFNQELATLLKAGMPLVQSLDLLKRRVETPLFRTVLDDVHEKVRSGSALSDAFAAHGDRFPRRVHSVAARRRAQRQPRRDAAPLRRVREGHCDGQEQDAVGANLPGHPRDTRPRPGIAHRLESRAGVCRLLYVVRRRTAARNPHHPRHLELPPQSVPARSGCRASELSSDSSPG